MIIEFDFDKFKKCYGKLCPCIVKSPENLIKENICPCKHFIETGECKCGLFKKGKYDDESVHMPD